MNRTDAAVLDDVIYPDSDGKPMADNTLQFDWIFKIVGELREMFAGQNVFVAGDLLWYPEKVKHKQEKATSQAPDAMIVFGRPPGYRGSYKQWEEEGIAPHVVFEILSPNNTEEEMEEKQRWYEQYGVEEYYFIDPYKNQLSGWIRRSDGRLWSVNPMAGHVSPRLKIRFDVNGEVVIYRPDGREFQDREDRVAEIEEELHKASLATEEARARAILAERQAREEAERVAKERIAKEQLAAKLRELGVNPDDILKPTS
ncbi:MAG TPA: Uma2 family endonuclease [Gemmata sp.]|jgi:Uma2 family endonuclease|nr:Uma2 family endonuclease [Gemmata sp.]